MKKLLFILFIPFTLFSQTNTNTANLLSKSNTFYYFKFDPTLQAFTNNVTITNASLVLTGGTNSIFVQQFLETNNTFFYLYAASNAIRFSEYTGPVSQFLVATNDGAGVWTLFTQDSVKPALLGTTLFPYSLNASNIVGGGKLYFTNGVSSMRSNTVALTTMTFPSSNVGWPNPLDCTIQVYINNAGITLSAIKKNGSTIFTSGNATLLLQPGESFSETYTVGTPSATYAPF